MNIEEQTRMKLRECLAGEMPEFTTRQDISKGTVTAFCAVSGITAEEVESIAKAFDISPTDVHIKPYKPGALQIRFTFKESVL